MKLVFGPDLTAVWPETSGCAAHLDLIQTAVNPTHTLLAVENLPFIALVLANQTYNPFLLLTLCL